MSEKKYTEDEVTLRTQIARLETNVNFLIKEWNFSKRIFWALFAPAVGIISAVSGFLTTLYLKFKPV